MGYVYKAKGDLNKALEHLKESLEIRVMALGYFHFLVSESMMAIGVASHSLGNSEEALNAHEEVIRIRDRIGRSDDVETASNLAIIIGLCSLVGKSKKALAYGKRAVPLMAKHYGADHPETKFVMSILKSIEESEKKY